MNKFRWQTLTFRNPYLFSLVLLVVVVAVNAYFQPDIFNRTTLNSNIRVFLPLIFLAVGQSIVILAGGIDLSVGPIVSIINALLATRLGADASPEKALQWMGIALLVGMAAGAINGFFVSTMRLQPIITTYATSFLFAGVALFILPSPGGGFPKAISTFYRDTTPLGLPLGFIPILLILLAWFVLRQTRYGRYLFAVGGNAEAAYATAVPVNMVQFSTYIISGLMAAFGGIAYTMLAGSGNAELGDPLTLQSITAVVIGGTALSGGVGGVAGAIIGSLVLGLVRNITSFANVNIWWQTFVNAAVIMVALAAGGFVQLLRRTRK